MVEDKKSLLREAARLSKHKQYLEAGELYQLAGKYKKAVKAFLKEKAFDRAGEAYLADKNFDKAAEMFLQAEELERAVKELGLKGYKMIGSSLSIPIEDTSMYPVWEMAEKLDVPVIIHFGVLGGGGGPPRNVHNMNPLSLWQVASDFPTLNFVIPHFGACYLRELLQLCWQCPNVSIDTSGSNQWTRWMPYEQFARSAEHRLSPL